MLSGRNYASRGKPKEVGRQFTKERNGRDDESMVGDGWWMDAEIGQSAVITREDDLQPTATQVRWLSYVLSRPKLVQNVPEVRRFWQKRVFNVKIQVTSEDELSIIQSELFQQ